MNDTISGVLSGDINPIDALKNVGQTILKQLPDNLTSSLKVVTDKLGSTGSSIVNNMHDVLTGDTSIGTALSNIGGTMQKQLLEPLQTNLTGTFDKLTGPDGIGGVFDSFTGEGGALDSVLDSFAGEGSGTLGKSFDAIAGDNGTFGEAIDSIGTSISGALGGITSKLSNAFGGLFGGDDASSKSVSETVKSTASSIGSFLGFSDGGKTPSKPDPSLEKLSGMKGVTGFVHTDEIVIPEHLTSIFTRIMSNNSEKMASKSVNGITTSSATSGKISSNVSKVSKVSSSAGIINNTTNNTTNEAATQATSMANVEKILTKLLDVNNKQLGHLGVSSKEAIKQNQIAKKSYKKDIDINDVSRQQSINKMTTKNW